MHNKLSKTRKKTINLAHKILRNQTVIQYDDEALVTKDFLLLFSFICQNIKVFQNVLRAIKAADKIEEELAGLYEDYTYHTDYRGRMYSANVKVYDWGDLDDAIDGMTHGEHSGRNYKRNPISKRQREWLKEDVFDDEHISNLWYWWIDFAREDLIEWLKEDYDYLIEEYTGFYGRSGGHFCLCKTIDVEYDWTDPKDIADCMFYSDTYVDENGLPDIEECEDWAGAALEVQEDVRKRIKDIKACLKKAEKYVKGMSFNEELMYRIDEAMCERMDDYHEWVYEQEKA